MFATHAAALAAALSEGIDAGVDDVTSCYDCGQFDLVEDMRFDEEPADYLCQACQASQVAEAWADYAHARSQGDTALTAVGDAIDDALEALDALRDDLKYA